MLLPSACVPEAAIFAHRASRRCGLTAAVGDDFDDVLPRVPACLEAQPCRPARRGASAGATSLLACDRAPGGSASSSKAIGASFLGLGIGAGGVVADCSRLRCDLTLASAGGGSSDEAAHGRAVPTAFFDAAAETFLKQLKPNLGGPPQPPMGGPPPAMGFGGGNDSPCLTCACQYDSSRTGGGIGSKTLKVACPNVPHHSYFDVTGKRLHPKTLMKVFFVGVLVGAAVGAWAKVRYASFLGLPEPEDEDDGSPRILSRDGPPPDALPQDQPEPSRQAESSSEDSDLAY